MDKKAGDVMRSIALVAFAVAGGFAGTAEACPNWQARAAFGQIALNEGFTPDPYVRNVTAGGGYGLQSCGFQWIGWAAAAPDFDLNYTTSGASTLTIRVDSNTDTILLINDPDGDWWYDDDGGRGAGAAIRIQNPKTGLYDIWIGTYDRASGIPARLIITELE